MASLAEQGHRVVLVTATGGELGEVDEGFLDPGETLAERRAVELAEAARILGVARHLFLGYEDSGMEGEASASRPGCFATADRGRGRRSAGRRLGRGVGRRPGRLRRARRLRAPGPRPGAQRRRGRSRAGRDPGALHGHHGQGLHDRTPAPGGRVRGSARRQPGRGRHHGRAVDPDHHRARRVAVGGDQARRHARPRQPDRRGQLLPGHARGAVRRRCGDRSGSSGCGPSPTGLGDGVREAGLVVDGAGRTLAGGAQREGVER